MNIIHTLFRRTSVALCAIAALTATGEASAQAGTITLNNSTTNSCAFSNMTVLPTGAVEVNCDGGSTPPTGATFSVSTLVSSLTTGQANATAFRITKSGSTTDAITVSISVGTACTSGSATVDFPAGSSSNKSIVVDAGASAGNCTLTIDSLTGTEGTISASAKSKTIPVSPPDPSGCTNNTVPIKDLGGVGATNLLQMPDGGITAYRLPRPTGTKVTGIFKMSFTTVSYPVSKAPHDWNYEISISKCKGEINPNADACYRKTENASDIGTVKWLDTNTSSRYPPSFFNKNATTAMCIAPKEEGTWYANVKYNVPWGCFNGVTLVCGWLAQWTNSSY